MTTMSVYVVVVYSGERRLGDLEVALTLEDLGPIVQQTVQLDGGHKMVSIVEYCCKGLRQLWLS